uniref:Uncharacterized protein n=1 Tax=Salmonella enteritidis TaxID=149539 RepID=A0A1S6KR55_SALEN|nr:hypothetical protein [Salmonella enterica]AQT23858.1 hypothetical protein [Salmonella enterica subsp. enterica serovar Enteritidis]
MALEQPDSTVLLSLLLLYVMSGILLMQFQYMYSERSIGYKFYLEVLMNAAASTQHKEQLQYLIINKPNSITMAIFTDFMILMGRAIATFMCVSKSHF